MSETSTIPARAQKLHAYICDDLKLHDVRDRQQKYPIQPSLERIVAFAELSGIRMDEPDIASAEAYRDFASLVRAELYRLANGTPTTSVGIYCFDNGKSLSALEASGWDQITAIRKARVEELNGEPSERELLEARYGQVWDTNQLAEDYDVLGFSAPFVAVQRKSDKQKGTLEFQHSPRYYFSFLPDHG